MCEHPTNPFDYLNHKLAIGEIFRFILSHPDMDHLDGFDSLMREFTVHNFWDSGARKDKPPFNGGPYKEKDWDRYAKVMEAERLAPSVWPLGRTMSLSMRTGMIPAGRAMACISCRQQRG